MIKEYLQIFPLCQDAGSVFHDRCILMLKEQICQCCVAIFQVLLEDYWTQIFFNATITFSVCGLQITVLNKLNYLFKLKSLKKYYKVAK